jgi:hypothetical protein
MESGSFESPRVETMPTLLDITFLHRIGVHVAGRVGTARRAQAQKVPYEWGHPKWALRVENWVRGSPLHMFLTAKDGLSKLEVVIKIQHKIHSHPHSCDQPG